LSPEIQPGHDNTHPDPASDGSESAFPAGPGRSDKHATAEWRYPAIACPDRTAASQTVAPINIAKVPFGRGAIDPDQVVSGK
jgi:hypothetical protein